MSTSVFQPASQATTKQQHREYIAKHLEIDGKTPDAATIERIVNARPKAAPKGNPATTRAFSLLR